MFSRLFVAGACALGLSGALGASVATAAPPRPLPMPWDVKPTQVQVWTEKGLHHTIDCPTLTADPACDARRWPANFHEVADEWGGYRALTRSGRWYEMGGYPKAFDAIDEADEKGLPGATKMEWDPYSCELIEGRQDPLTRALAAGILRRTAGG